MKKTNHKLKEKFVGATIGRPHFGGITKKENGITLIALIITIIVMLVLTGVTLAVTLGENGLIAKANEAKIQMQIETDREELLSAVIGAIGIDGKVDFTYLDSHLPAGFTGSNGTYTSSNGHEFTVSEDGEVKYTGSGTPGDDVIENGGEIETGAVDLNGQYYSDSDEYNCYIENNSTFTTIDFSAPITVDKDNKSFTVKVEEDFEIVMNYEMVVNNDEVINKLLFQYSDGEEHRIWYQNLEGFDYELEGIYLNESGNRRLLFDNESHTFYVEEKSSTDGSWTTGSSSSDIIYFGYNGKYYLECNYEFNSEDLNTIVYREDTYTKQTETEPDEPEIIPHETTVEFSYDGTEENMETWYVVSVDETARTMEIALPRGMDAFTVGKSDPVAIENATDLDGDNVVEDFEIAIYSWNHMGDSIDTFFNNFSANFPSNVVGYSRNCSYSYSGDYLFEGTFADYDIKELDFEIEFNYSPEKISNGSTVYYLSGLSIYTQNYLGWDYSFGYYTYLYRADEHTYGNDQAGIVVKFYNGKEPEVMSQQMKLFPTVTITY